MGALKVAVPCVPPPLVDNRDVKLVTGTIKALVRVVVGSCGARKAMYAVVLSGDISRPSML